MTSTSIFARLDLAVHLSSTTSVSVLVWRCNYAKSYATCAARHGSFPPLPHPLPPSRAPKARARWWPLWWPLVAFGCPFWCPSGVSRLSRPSSRPRWGPICASAQASPVLCQSTALLLRRCTTSLSSFYHPHPIAARARLRLRLRRPDAGAHNLAAAGADVTRRLPPSYKSLFFLSRRPARCSSLPSPTATLRLSTNTKNCLCHKAPRPPQP